MARMLPDVAAAVIDNIGERLVYEALRDQLPHTWIVRYHSPACWLQNLRLRECEADFIVLAPKRGLLVIEVKSSFGYDCENSVWYRLTREGARESTRNPFDQAASTKHRLVERISQKLGHRHKDDFPGIFGHVVIYPRGQIVGRLPLSVDPSLMIAYHD